MVVFGGYELGGPKLVLTSPAFVFAPFLWILTVISYLRKLRPVDSLYTSNDVSTEDFEQNQMNAQSTAQKAPNMYEQFPANMI